MANSNPAFVVAVVAAFLCSLHPIAVMAASNCELVDSTSDKCRSADFITVADERVTKGDSNKIIRLPALQKEVQWVCGSSLERTAWGKPANELRVNYDSDGTIEWIVYKCANSGGIHGVSFIHLVLAVLVVYLTVVY